jgi:hypothetical protein
LAHWLPLISGPGGPPARGAHPSTGRPGNYVGPAHAEDAGAGAHVFNVACNGKAVLHDFDLFLEAGENRPVVKRIPGLEPNSQGKLLLDFAPLKDYATVTAIEVLSE